MNIHRILFSLFLLFALLAAFLFFPSRAVLIAGAILMISLGFSIFAILRRQVRHYRAGQIGRGTLMRNSTVEIGAMFLVLGLSILLGRIAMGYILGWISGLWGSTSVCWQQ